MKDAGHDHSLRQGLAPKPSSLVPPCQPSNLATKQPSNPMPLGTSPPLKIFYLFALRFGKLGGKRAEYVVRIDSTMSGKTIWRAATAALMIGLCSLTFAETVTKEVKDEVLAKMTQIITTYAYVPGADFSKLPDMLAANKDEIDKATTEADFQEAVNKTLAGFGITHLSMQTPEQSEERVDGATVGLGVSVHVEDDGILIIRVVPKSAAEDAKLQPGDLITEADGKVVHTPIDLQGKEGQPVDLTVKGPNGKIRKVHVVRRKFSTVRPEELTWVDKDTALLKIYTFDLSYNSERVDELMKKAANAKNLIVDLRDNGGGLVSNVQHFLGLVLPSHTAIGSFISKSLVDKYVSEEHGSPNDLKGMAAWSSKKIHTYDSGAPVYKGHMVVLVNAGTGSGAEIAAAAMRETLGTPVVGSKSAGAVLVALMQNLPDGYTLLFPITDYITAKGVRLEGNGVTPDVVAKDPAIPLPGTPDDVVNQAVKLAEHPSSLKKSGA